MSPLVKVDRRGNEAIFRVWGNPIVQRRMSEERVHVLGGAALGVPGEQIKEDEEEVAGTTFDEPNAELRGLPPQPEGLREKGLYAAPSGLHGGPAPPVALCLASKPFSLNAAPPE